MESFLPLAEQYGYVAIFAVLLGAGLGVPIPEDVPLLAGGWLAYHGALNVWVVLAVSMVGVATGDSLIFLAGRKAGSAVNRFRLLRRHIGGKRKARVDRYFSKWGNWTVFFGRFVAGLRAPTFFTAGASGMRYATFIAFDMAAAALSVPIWIGLAYYLGDKIDGVLEWIASARQVVLITLAVAVPVALLVWLVRRRRSSAPLPPETPPPEPPPES